MAARFLEQAFLSYRDSGIPQKGTEHRHSWADLVVRAQTGSLVKPMRLPAATAALRAGTPRRAQYEPAAQEPSMSLISPSLLMRTTNPRSIPLVSPSEPDPSACGLRYNTV